MSTLRRLPLPSIGCALALAVPAVGQFWQSDGPAAGDRLGHALASIADLDGDGVRDLVCGAPGAAALGGGTGAVLLLSGADGTLIRRHDGAAAGRGLGSAVCAAGDQDGDGVEDYAASARRDNDFEYPSGEVFVWSGADGSLLHRYASATNWDRFGHAIAGVGDVDGDGFADLAVAAPDDDFAGPGSGSVFVHSGADGRLLHVFRGNRSWDRMGWSLAGLGDVDGDGRPEIGVGIPYKEAGAREAGAVDVYSGRTGALVVRARGRGRDSWFGSRLVGLGDVTGDGLADFAASGLDRGTGISGYQGHVQIVSGADARVLATMETVTLGESFGEVLAAADLTGDGYTELLVGMPLAGVYSGSGLGSGAVRVFSGPSGRLLAEWRGGGAQQAFGTGLAALDADLDGDGLHEFAVSSPGAAAQAGQVVARSGPAMTRLEVSNLIAGANATLTIRDGFSFSTYRVEASLTGPGGAAPAGSPGLDLAAPLLFVTNLTVDVHGDGQASVPVPLAAAGQPVWLQAWVASSNPLAATQMVATVIQ